MAKVTRLEVLKRERDKIQKFNTLSFNLIKQCYDYFTHEIECIEKYGSENPEYDLEEE